MRILGIETSCDETAVCIIEAHSTSSGQAKETEAGTVLTVLGNQLYSQVELHKQYGGVFPMMAKREHAKNLVPLLEKCLAEVKQKEILSRVGPTPSSEKGKARKISSLFNFPKIKEILAREGELFVELKKLLETVEKPNIDAIAVTNGPGLEPALWVGVTFAQALGEAWNIPVIPTNHMEGHIVVSALSPSSDKEYLIKETAYPAIALLISGGHTQLVLIKDNLKYKIIGGTRDDAVGEAFDKVARMLGLPYPGGPQISKYADAWKEKGITKQTFKFPRPMIHSKDLDFSFSGLKTSVLYTIKEIPEMTEDIKQEIAYEFKEAVIDVLVTKTKMAIMEYSAKTLIAGGGVIADKDIRQALKNLSTELGIKFQLPEISASTDNALMITVAGLMNIKAGKKSITDFKASGNLSL